MPTTAEYVVGGYCKIGQRKFDCGALTVNYALNTVPTASATFAVGVDSNGGPAEIHKGLEERKKNGFMQPAELYIRRGTEEKKVFDGYLTGLGYARSHGSMAVNASFAGKVLDLAFSSFVVNNPQHLVASQFNTDAMTKSDTGDPLSNFLTCKVMGAVMNNGGKDIGGGIVDGLKHLTELPLLQLGSAADCMASADSNKPAQEVLKKIITSGGKAGGGGFSGAVPAKFTHAQVTTILHSIELWMSHQLGASGFTTSIWDKLVGILAPGLKLAVIPLVDRTLLVPFTPCLSKYGMTIKAEDIASVSVNTQIARPVRGVMVLGGLTAADGTLGIGQGTDNFFGAGCFSKGDDNLGTVLFVTPPEWISMLPGTAAQSTLTPHTTGVSRRGRKPIRTAHTLVKDRPEPPSTQPVLEDVRDLYKSYGESIYYQEMLRGRRGTLSTNLRWDIAPGSTVRVETYDPKSPLKGKFEAKPFVGSVDRVSIWVDAEGARAGTAFQLSYCRTEKENKDMGTDKHPLYDGDPFTGAMLVGGKP